MIFFAMIKWAFLTAVAGEEALRQAELSDAQGRLLTSFAGDILEECLARSGRSL